MLVMEKAVEKTGGSLMKHRIIEVCCGEINGEERVLVVISCESWFLFSVS